MASNGSVSVAVTSYDTLKFNWAQMSQSISNNNTVISWNLQLISTNYGRIDSSASKTWSVTVNGTNYSGTNTVGIANNATKTLAAGSTTISHNADGTKTFSFSFSQQFNINFNGYVGTISGSGTGVLNTIPRASSITANNGTLGTSNTLTINRASSAFMHTITWSCGMASGTVTTKTSNTSVAWDTSNGNTVNLAAQNKTGTSVSVKFTVTTYNGSTAIGTSTKTISMAIPASVKPTISAIAVTEGGDVPSGFPFVQGKSKFTVAITAAGVQGSTITSYATQIDGLSYSGKTFTSNVLKEWGMLEVSTTVMDSRGRKATLTESVDVLSYNAPNIASLTADRYNADGTLNDQGAYMKISYNVSITSLLNHNAKSIKIKYKKSSQDTYTSVTVAMSSYSINGNHIIAADTGSSYDIVLEATDSFGTSSAFASVPTAYTIFNVRANGRGLAFGKVSERDAFEFDDPIYIAGVPFGIETVTSGDWTYHKWVDGRMEAECNMIITNEDCTTAVGGWYRTDILSPSNFPIPFVGNNPTVHMSFSTSAGTGAVVWETTGVNLNAPPSFYLIRMASANSVSGVVSILARGRWKE